MRFQKRFPLILTLWVVGTGWALVRPASALTQAEEIALGQRIAKEVTQRYPALPSKSPLSQRVKRIGARIAALSSRKGIPYSYTVIDAPKMLNAFSLPGGPIFITRRLVEFAKNDAEIASILGHETAHTEFRHAALYAEGQERAQKAAAKLGLNIFGPVVMRSHADFMKGASAVFFALGSLGYDRKSEDQADIAGIRYASRLGYDPRAGIAILQRMQTTRQIGALERYFSTHPPVEDRAKHMAAVIQGEHLLQLAQAHKGPRLNDADKHPQPITLPGPPQNSVRKLPIPHPTSQAEPTPQPIPAAKPQPSASPEETLESKDENPSTLPTTNYQLTAPFNRARWLPRYKADNRRPHRALSSVGRPIAFSEWAAR